MRGCLDAFRQEVPVSVSNSALSTSAYNCQCTVDFKASDSNFCVSCKAYFNASDIKAYWNSDYLSISVEFSKADRTSSLNSWSTIFHKATLAKLGENPDCSWRSKNTILNVKMGKNPTLVDEAVVINEENVISATGICSYSATALTSKAEIVSTKSFDSNNQSYYEVLFELRDRTAELQRHGIQK